MNPIEQIRAELRKRGFKMKCLIPLTKLLIAFVIPFAHLMKTLLKISPAEIGYFNALIEDWYEIKNYKKARITVALSNFSAEFKS